MASYSPKRRGLALVTLIFCEKIEMGGGNIIHRQGSGISTFASIDDLKIATALFTHMHPVETLTFSVKIAEFFLVGVVTEGTGQAGY